MLSGLFESLEVWPTPMDQIGASQQGNPQILDIMDKLRKGETSSYLSRYTINEMGGCDEMEGFVFLKLEAW